jgi:hypothetical protein
MIGPSMVPMPPIMTMNIENAVQFTVNAASGEMRRLPRKYSAPANPAPNAATRYTPSFVARTFTPWLSDATSLSRMASRARPCRERRNQYTSRDVPGYANILGAAATNAYVTVNNQPAYRKGEFFRTELAADNSSTALWLGVTNLAAVHTSTNDIVVTNIGNIFIPKTAEVFGYDADGNMTNDGRWTITWDGENRALSFTSLSSGPSASRK